MFLAIYLSVLLATTSINCSLVPFIRNVTLVSRYKPNSTTVSNYTIQQCLCLSIPSFVAFNWYPNQTCQLFYSFPNTYTIQSTSQARLYFPQKIFPNASQCCMSNTQTLMNKLSTANRISVNISTPRCLTFDNHGYLVTVSSTLRMIVRFYPNNLTIVTSPISPIFSQNPNSITYYDEKYFVGFETFILIVNSNTLTIVKNITGSFFNGIRDIGFLNNGQTLLAVSTYNRSLLFFNRSNNYSLIKAQYVNFNFPHGLHIVNDNLFYLTAWSDNAIYSFSTGSSNSSWTQQIFVNAISIAPMSGGAHITIDDCDRVWFSLFNNGILIFNRQGVFLHNVTRMTPSNFDTLLMENYVLYLSDIDNNQIVRIDPHIQC